MLPEGDRGLRSTAARIEGRTTYGETHKEEGTGRPLNCFAEPFDPSYAEALGKDDADLQIDSADVY